MLLLLGANSARAATVTYTIDPQASSIGVSSVTSAFGSNYPSTQQGPDSLLARYTGSIVADLTDSSIQFLTGSTLVAQNSGSWTPGSNWDTEPVNYATTAQPANYGQFTDLTALLGFTTTSAVRGLQLALVDGAPKPLVAGQFDEAGTDTAITAGQVIYSKGALPPITDLTILDPSPTQAAPGGATLSTSPNVETLTFPFAMTVSWDVNFLTITNTYTGTIVATRNVPEPASLTVVAVGLAVLAGYSRRRLGRHLP